MMLPLLLATLSFAAPSAETRPKARPKPVLKPAPPAAMGPVRMLAPGTYARTEVPKDSGGLWWGLVKLGDAFILRSTLAKCTALALDEARPKVMDGVEVTTPDSEDALVLVRGLKLVAGPVVQAQDLKVEGNAAGDQKVMGAFAGEPFEIWSESMGEKTPRAILRLKQGPFTHALLVLEDCDDCTWDLLWAGDLDADGRLDALVGTTHPKNKGLMRLFLSSKAKEPQLAALAARQAWDFGD